MTTISVTLKDETAMRLREMARRRDSTPEEILATHAEDLVLTHEEKVRRVGQRIIEEDADLLRRLA